QLVDSTQQHQSHDIVRTAALPAPALCITNYTYAARKQVQECVVLWLRLVQEQGASQQNYWNQCNQQCLAVRWIEKPPIAHPKLYCGQHDASDKALYDRFAVV